ncbi:MAG TPA: ArdC family protein [Solirubrobacteraceae bacterium]|nr:ArdC family protein [Solirubrobacteraceae bacterium]
MTALAAPSKHDELLRQLTAGIAELTSSHEWARYLEAQSRFHAYSFLNTLAILRARPDTAHVAGFRAWQAMGRQVRKGSKGIAILCPVVSRTRVRDEETGEEQLIVGSPARFRIGYVFAYEDTDGEPLPEPCRRLDGGAPGDCYTALVGVAHSLGYIVEEDYLPGGRNGECDFAAHRIRIEVRNAERQQCKSLGHEVAHALLHDPQTGWKGSRELAELEAESTAFVVMSALGIDSGDYSFGYVASWAGGGSEAIAAIRTSGSRIQRTADAILTALDAIEERAA